MPVHRKRGTSRYPTGSCTTQYLSSNVSSPPNPKRKVMHLCGSSAVMRASTVQNRGLFDLILKEYSTSAPCSSCPEIRTNGLHRGSSSKRVSAAQTLGGEACRIVSFSSANMLLSRAAARAAGQLLISRTGPKESRAGAYNHGGPNGGGRLGAPMAGSPPDFRRSEEHTSELQSLMRISYAVFCLKKK